MKSDIHPQYRAVVFQDTGSGDLFFTRSTIDTSDTIDYEGETYPLAKVEISSASHPFFTGQMKIVDTAGRVERFEKRYGRRRRVGASDAQMATDVRGDSNDTEAPAESADADDS